MPSEPISTLGEKKLIKRIIKKAELSNPSYFSKNTESSDTNNTSSNDNSDSNSSNSNTLNSNTFDYSNSSIKSKASNSFTAIGDDASLIDLSVNGSNFNSNDSYLVATSDMMLKHSHFPKEMSYFQMGWKVVVVNISDLAAMGASPIGILLSVAVPKNLMISQFDEIIDGVVAACSYYDAPLIGGDTNSSYTFKSLNNFNKSIDISYEDEIILSATALGHVEKNKVLMKFGFKEGDYIALTGEIGLAALGFELLNSDINNYHSLEHKLIKNSYEKSMIKIAKDKILNPVAKLVEGKKLKNSGFVTSATDITDGLASEIYEMFDSNLRINGINSIDAIDTIDSITGINSISSDSSNDSDFYTTNINNTNTNINIPTKTKDNFDNNNITDSSSHKGTTKAFVPDNNVNVTYVNLDYYINSPDSISSNNNHNNSNSKNTNFNNTNSNNSNITANNTNTKFDDSTEDNNNNNNSNSPNSSNNRNNNINETNYNKEPNKGILGFKIYEELIPVASNMKKVAKYINRNPLDLALYFGEDFELLFTFERNKAKELKKILDFHVIGEVTNTGAVEIVDKRGNVSKLSSKGYEHLK
ncbi:MAG: thiamine-phosphate kinase [Methanobacteriaceae archaeon]